MGLATLALIAWRASAGPAHAAIAPEDEGGKSAFVRVVAQDLGGASLEVRIPPSALHVELGWDGLRRVGIDGLQAIHSPGKPELPVVIVALGVPEGARVSTSYVVSPDAIVPGAPVAPAEAVDPIGGARRRLADPLVYEGRAPWPAERVFVEEVRFRSLRLARVTIHPARYDPATHDLLLSHAFDIRIEFQGGIGFGARGRAFDPLERRIIERALWNGASVLSRRIPPESREMQPLADAAPRPRTRFLAHNPGVKIHVASPGLVRITRADLESIGFDPGPVEPRNLELSFRGVPVPCRVKGEDDGRFDVGDVIEFYGAPGSGRFSRESVYWLAEKDTAGMRFPWRPAVPAGAPVVGSFLHTERFEAGESIYTFGDPAQEGDPHFFWIWFEDNPYPPRVTSFTYEANLPDVAGSPNASILRAFFAGRSDPPDDPDHRVRFLVNGVEVGESTWNGRTFHLAEIPFDTALLESGGANAFRFDYVPISLPDSYYLDWFEVAYPRSTRARSERLLIAAEGTGPIRYEVTGFNVLTDPLVLDVTDPLAPVELSGATATGDGPFTLSFEEDVSGVRRYLVVGDGGRVQPSDLVLDVPSNLVDPINGADLLIVVPDGWETALEPLAARRRAQGRRVVVASLGEVADEFGGGNVDDRAVRDFVAFAYQSWQPPAPSALLLVGEPNLDPLNDLQRSPFHHWMPIHFGVTAGWGETITDTWFGAVSGADLLPDLAVGRFSVRTAEQAAELVAKVLAYESEPPSGASWANRVLQIASSEQGFEEALDAADSFLPAHFTVRREYRRSGATAATIVDGFNSGALVASFMGHGNWSVWGDSPGGAFFTTSDVSAIANFGRLPLLTAFDCLNALIAHPTVPDSLAEVFHNQPTTGALAIWSASGYGYASEYGVLQTVLFRTIFADRIVGLGEATTSALVETYLTGPTSIDLVKGMILLADPSARLALDSDGDGTLDVRDCAPTNAGAWAVPPEVARLRWTSEDDAMTWESLAADSGSGTLYDAIRGSVTSLPVGSEPELCLAQSVSETTTSDPTLPEAGEGLWYLVRGRNACAVGTYGFDGRGAERTSAACP